MNEIEKEIEEMAIEIQKSVDGCAEYWATLIAKHLIKQDYRNVKDKVVLDKEEYEALKTIESYHIKSCGKGSVVLSKKDLENMADAKMKCINHMAIITRKETATEIICKLINYEDEIEVDIKDESQEDVSKALSVASSHYYSKFVELAKEYGVEVE